MQECLCLNACGVWRLNRLANPNLEVRVNSIPAKFSILRVQFDIRQPLPATCVIRVDAATQPLIAMATGVRSMRFCLRAFRHAATPAPRRAGAPIYVARRAFSSTPTPWRPAAKKDEADEREVDEEEDDDVIIDSAELNESLDTTLTGPDIDSGATARFQEQVVGSINATLSEAAYVPKVHPARSFWHEEEEDPELLTDERDEDVFEEDDIMSMAHGKLEEFREYREYARIAAWEMPLLSSG